MAKKIVGLSFPENNRNLGLEPSILNVLPQGDNVEFSTTNRTFNDKDIEFYLCSVYIAGMGEFREWARQHDTRKIVVGGYHPTMFPEDFINFADKVVMGPCDDLEATLAQKDVLFQRGYYDKEQAGNSRFVSGRILRTIPKKEGSIRVHGETINGERPEKPTGRSEVLTDRVIPGILTFKGNPRYDLYDIENNQQVIPDKAPNDLATSINTSFGCPYQCDFCCTPVMFGPRLIQKPLSAIERETNLIKKRLDNAGNGRQRFLFIRDENFTLQKDFKERLETIAKTEAQLYLFASANTLTDNVVDTLAENNVYMVCLGLEDPTKEYRKNRLLNEAVSKLKDRGIYTYLSFIVDPLEVVGAEKGEKFYNALNQRFWELKPEMVCGNFLMPFPGTPLWDDYYHLISEDDFKAYDSKTPFLVKNEVVADKMKYFMFKSQWDYYTSDMYNDQVRKFDTGDTLHGRFLELKDEFEELMDGVKHRRP